jgi:hypothetical protein
MTDWGEEWPDVFDRGSPKEIGRAKIPPCTTLAQASRRRPKPHKRYPRDVSRCSL